ncbi:hypothetical protein [Aureimonas sp. AU20]|uniref:hypothetical protein n=1 Tax=Aureimonas sp. AU20 TaxID=1349819 RepID=UPI0011E02785|nr:hypothetical protein [Aureimonas sp. AU20]
MTDSNSNDRTKPAHPPAVSESERRALRRKRLERLAKLGSEAPVDPATEVRVYYDPSAIDTTGYGFRSLLIPMPEMRNHEGRRPLRAVAERLQVACCIHVLRCYDEMRASGVGSAEAIETELKSVVPLSFDNVKRIGRKGLDERKLPITAVDMLASRLYEGEPDLIRAHRQLAGLLNTSLTRMNRIIAATDASWSMPQKDWAEANSLVMEAFNFHPNSMPRIDLVRISCAADIQPSIIWSRYQIDAPMYEVARFATQLLFRGLRTSGGPPVELKMSHFAVADELLHLNPSDRYHEMAAVQLVSDLLKSADPAMLLDQAIDKAAMAESDLLIE